MLSAVSFAGSYSQDFNTLPHAGTSFFYGGLTDLDARPIEAVGMAGWQLYKPAGQSDFVTFIADGGNSAASSMRSFGGFEAPERALGSIANELGSYAYGVTLTNDTGGTLTSFTLTFAGEQWHESGALAAQSLRFEYAIGEGVSIEQGTFVAAQALDFTAPQHGGTIRTLDGNDPANRTIVTATITGISWAPGTELALRWSDDDAADADHGLGIDDLTLTASPLNLTPPVFMAGAAQTFALPENSPSATFVGLAAATDPDAPVEPLSYSIIAGDPSNAFAIDTSGQLTIADAALLDLDFENGEQVAVLTVQVSDGLHTAEQTVTVNVSPANDNAPVFAAGASQTLSIDENSLSGAIVGQATATDADLPAETLAYSIIAGDPSNAFAIDSSGQLTIVDAALLDLDFENGEQVAVLTIQTTDGANATIQTVTVNVLPLNDNAPPFAAGASQAVSIVENSLSGAIVAQAAASDADLPAETLAFAIIDGDPTGAFAIDSSGQLTIANPALLDLDYENGEQVALLTVQVTDGANAATQTIAVSLLPLNDNQPAFVAGASQPLSIDENSLTGVIVGQATATDADLPAETLVYSIIDGDPTNAFAIDSSGQLTIADASLLDLDFENGEQVAVLSVQVSDGFYTAQQTVTVNVLPLNDNAPTFAAGASQTLSVDENSPSGTVVGQATATDADLPAETLVYSIIDGDPANAFAIDASGQLTIADAALLDLDFENGEQVAILTIQATDGTNPTTQAVTVNVLPLNDNAPQFTTSSSLAVDENSVDVATLAATDADLPSQTLVFTITGGADAALFAITNGNELKLLAGLDFESPTDSDVDGVYLVEVQVDDGAGGIAALSLAISVNDVDETPPPLMAFARSSSPEEIAALDEAFGEESLTASLAAAALLT